MERYLNILTTVGVATLPWGTMTYVAGVASKAILDKTLELIGLRYVTIYPA